MRCVYYWKINKPDEAAVSGLMLTTDLNRMTAELLVTRGICTDKAAEIFLHGSELSDPFEITDMDKAADAVNQAVVNGERICIYGDYDCDGVTSSALLYLYLEMHGADVFCYIPERAEGYGLNMHAIDFIASEGAQLIVTVDNGISAIEEAEYIAKLGIKLVVTDHHTVGDTLPKALAVVDPHREDDSSSFKSFAGVGVALKLAAACEGGDMNVVFEQFADIAAIGTVADLVSLTGENRTIVSLGLRYLENTENEGLHYLKQKCLKGVLNSTAIAFTLAPRINAAGRFGSPRDAFNALVSSGDEAERCVDKLIKLNDERKAAEQGILDEILGFINENPDILCERVLVLASRGWHSGVIGIVAAKLMNMFSKPVFLMSVNDEGSLAVGSARSFDGFNIYNALYACKELLVKYGGHEKAGGFTVRVENIEQFKSALLDYCAEKFPAMPRFTVSADKVLRPDEITYENSKQLNVLAPFGTDNPEPVFAIVGAVVESVVSLKGGAHTRLNFKYGQVSESALLFYRSPDSLGLNAGDRVDMLVNLSENDYNGRQSVTIKVVDWRMSGINQSRCFAAKDAYEAFLRGEALDKRLVDAMTPDRSELVAVYKAIDAAKDISIESLMGRLADKKINYAKLHICVGVFAQKGLVEYDCVNQRVKLLNVAKKVSLDDAELLTRLKNAKGSIV